MGIKMKKQLLAILLLIVPIVVLAGDYTYTVNDNMATITGYSGTGGDIEIPAVFGTTPVVGITNSVFENRMDLTGVVIPDSITQIGNVAFHNCDSLTHVTFGSNACTLGHGVFESCGELTHLTNFNYVVSAEYGTFWNCSSLESIVLSEDFSSVERFMFSGCSKLRSITLSSGVTNIGIYAFANCDVLKSIVIPASVTVIGDNAFAGCDAIKSIVIPASVVVIGDKVFEYCQNLTGVYCEGNCPTYGSDLFKECASVINVYKLNVTTGWSSTLSGQPVVSWQNDFSFVKEGNNYTLTGYTGTDVSTHLPPKINGIVVTKIGDAAFRSCQNLGSISIPPQITHIGVSAFNSSSLIRVGIPEDVVSIGAGAFYNCSQLKEIEVKESNSYFSSKDGVLFNKFKENLIAYPAGKEGAYTLPDSVSMIQAFAFYGSQGLTDLSLGNHITSFGERAFSMCSSLTNVSIGFSIQQISANAFSACSNLTTITIPKALTIQSNAFDACTSLINITIPKVGTIDKYAFKDCSALKEISIPNAFVIRGFAFSGCSSLATVTNGSRLNDLEDFSFSNCSALTKIYCEGDAPNAGGANLFLGTPLVKIYYFPNTRYWSDTFVGRPTVLCDWADYEYNITNGKATITGYTGLGGDITIPDDIDGIPVTTIGYKAFDGASAVTSVEIPSGVVTIENSVFRLCSLLTKITIPDTVTSLGIGLFYKCHSLTEIDVDAANANFSSVDGVLFNKDKSTLIAYPAGKQGDYVLPDTVGTIGTRAFISCTNLIRVTIPSSISEVGDYAFFGCSNLKAVYCKGDAPSAGSQIFGNTPSSLTIYYVDGTSGWGTTFEGRSTALWVLCDYSFTVLSDEVTIVDYTGTESAIHVPSTIEGYPVTTIADNAFAQNTNLVNVTFPDSVTSVGASVFLHCDSLTTLTFGTGLSNILTWAFAECPNLKSVCFKGNAPTVGTDIFDASPLVNVYYLSGTTGWGPTFSDRPTMLWTWKDYEYTIVHHLGTIGHGGHPPYRTVTITGYLGKARNISIPTTIEGCRVTIIGEHAFEFSDITRVIIPNQVRTIEAFAFMRCDLLKSVSIPKGVTSLGDSAFAFCSELKNLCFKGNAPTTMGSDVFSGSPLTSYYTRGATGWFPLFGGKPAKLWAASARNRAMANNQFSYDITGPDELRVLVEKTENIVTPSWAPVSTNILSGGSSFFSDAVETNKPACFYRLRML